MTDAELILLSSHTHATFPPLKVSFTPSCPLCCSDALLQTAVALGKMLCSSLHVFPLKSLDHLAIEFTLVPHTAQVSYLVKMP